MMRLVMLLSWFPLLRASLTPFFLLRKRFLFKWILSILIRWRRLFIHSTMIWLSSRWSLCFLLLLIRFIIFLIIARAFILLRHFPQIEINFLAIDFVLWSNWMIIKFNQIRQKFNYNLSIVLNLKFYIILPVHMDYHEAKGLLMQAVLWDI